MAVFSAAAGLAVVVVAGRGVADGLGVADGFEAAATGVLVATGFWLLAFASSLLLISSVMLPPVATFS